MIDIDQKQVHCVFKTWIDGHERRELVAVHAFAETAFRHALGLHNQEGPCLYVFRVEAWELK